MHHVGVGHVLCMRLAAPATHILLAVGNPRVGDVYLNELSLRGGYRDEKVVGNHVHDHAYLNELSLRGGYLDGG